MATIRQLGPGRWQARFRDNEGRQRAGTRRTKAEAQAWLDEQTAALVRGDWRSPRAGRVTVGELSETWYATTSALRPSTRASYRVLLDTWVLPRWAEVPVRAVEHSAVAAWAAEVAGRRSPSTTRKAVGVLRSVLTLAVRDRRIAVNPAVGVKSAAPRKRDQRFLTAADLEVLADAMPTERDRVLVLLLGWTGIRWGEAAALRVSRIDMLRRRLRIAESVVEVGGHLTWGPPKNHQARTVALPPFLVDELGTHLRGAAPSDLLFRSEVAGPIRANWRRRVFTPAAEAVGLVPPTLRVHDLRHTAASLAIASGANVKAVQHQLGHGSATLTLDLYGHLFPDDLEALSTALEALRGSRDVHDSLTAGTGTVVGIDASAR